MNPKNPKGAKAGARSTHADPMSFSDRLDNYTEQNGHGGLTPRQRKRLIKKERAGWARDARKAGTR